MITQALANNRDLRVAAANIAATRAISYPARQPVSRSRCLGPLQLYRARIERRGSQAVGGTGTGGTGTGTGTGNGTGGVGTGTGGTGGTVVTGANGSGSAWSVNLGTTAFELDLFGRVRSLTGAALDRYFATEAAARATRLTLVGDIADAWLNYAANQSLLAIAQQTAASAERSVTLTRARLQGGFRRAPTCARRNRCWRPLRPTSRSRRRRWRRISTPCNCWSVRPSTPRSCPVRSRSLAHRRDAARRARLRDPAASTRCGAGRISAARRQWSDRRGARGLFPRISLTGLVGFASNALTSLFSGGSFNYSVAPSVSYPIFQAGAGVANVQYSKAQRDAALATYEKTIQTAFQETADALARQGTIDDQLGANRRFLNAAADTYRLTEASYRGGVTPFLNTLDAQRSLYSAQRTVIATQLTAATNRVTLYRVLGGDSLLEATTNGPVALSPGQ